MTEREVLFVRAVEVQWGGVGWEGLPSFAIIYDNEKKYPESCSRRWNSFFISSQFLFFSLPPSPLPPGTSYRQTIVTALYSDNISRDDRSASPPRRLKPSRRLQAESTTLHGWLGLKNPRGALDMKWFSFLKD